MINPHRALFPCLDQMIKGNPLVYLDNAATTLKPQVVIDQITHHYSKMTANVHRGVHTLSTEATAQYEATRTLVKEFINASSEKEIIFTKGTTESINLVAQSLTSGKFLSPGDEILVSRMEHHSNIVPWQLILERSGAKLIEIPITQNGDIDQEAFLQLLGPKTKMMAVTHVSNSLGTVNPIKKMIAAAKSHGALTLIDAAQSIAHTPIDVQDLNVDFFCFSGHKMYGPTGIGILYGKEELLDKMPPYQGGGAMIKTVSFEKTTFNDLPEKFEAGTPHISGAICLKSAIEFIQNIGFEEIARIENNLTNMALAELRQIKKLRLIGNPEKRACVISFFIDGAHPHDVGTLLDQQGVAIRTGHHCTAPLMDFYGIPATCRASFAIYNDESDVEKFLVALHKSLELL